MLNIDKPTGCPGTSWEFFLQRDPAKTNAYIVLYITWGPQAPVSIKINTLSYHIQMFGATHGPINTQIVSVGSDPPTSQRDAQIHTLPTTWTGTYIVEILMRFGIRNPTHLPVWALSPVMILSSSTLWEIHVIIFWKPTVFNDHRRAKKGLFITTQHYNPCFPGGKKRTVWIWILIQWKFQTYLQDMGDEWMLQPWNVSKHKNTPGSPWAPVFSPVGLRVSPFSFMVRVY